MLAVKIYQNKEERKESFNKTVNNITSYICNKLVLDDVKVLSDDYGVEIVSGHDHPSVDDNIVVELVIRKTIVINKEDIDNRSSLDRFISGIKHFCDQAKIIEKDPYLPLHMR